MGRPVGRNGGGSSSRRVAAIGGHVINFKGWLKLQEVGTSTGDVAVFSRQVMPIVRRVDLGPWDYDYRDPFFDKKKSRKRRKIDQT